MDYVNGEERLMMLINSLNDGHMGIEGYSELIKLFLIDAVTVRARDLDSNSLSDFTGWIRFHISNIGK